MMLTGNNGILTRAGEARDLTGEKQIAERVQLAYLAALTGGKGQATEQSLRDELDKEFGQNKYELSEDLTKVIIDEKEYDVGGIVVGEPGKKITKDINGTTIKKTDGVTEPWLPTSKAEILNNNLTTGLTIKDEDDNEWVWIEVPKTVTEGVTEYNDIYDALRNYCEPVISKTGSDYTTTTCGWTDEWYEGCGLTPDQYETKKKAMLNSIKDNGGFYIGKYETGIDDSSIPENATTIAGLRTASGNTTQKAVIQPNKQPYNYVTCSQAEKLAEGLNPDSENKTTSLMFGIQWDLVLKFISVKENLGNDNTILTSNSTTWGNYYNNTYNITNPEAWYSTDYGQNWTKGAYNKTAEGKILLTAGAHTNFSKQNIFDLAGNVWEWTLEKTSSTDDPCSIRGGNYSNKRW